MQDHYPGDRQTAPQIELGARIDQLVPAHGIVDMDSPVGRLIITHQGMQLDQEVQHPGQEEQVFGTNTLRQLETASEDEAREIITDARIDLLTQFGLAEHAPDSSPVLEGLRVELSALNILGEDEPLTEDHIADMDDADIVRFLRYHITEFEAAKHRIIEMTSVFDKEFIENLPTVISEGLLPIDIETAKERLSIVRLEVEDYLKGSSQYGLFDRSRGKVQINTVTAYRDDNFLRYAYTHERVHALEAATFTWRQGGLVQTIGNLASIELTSEDKLRPVAPWSELHSKNSLNEAIVDETAIRILGMRRVDAAYSEEILAFQDMNPEAQVWLKELSFKGPSVIDYAKDGDSQDRFTRLHLEYMLRNTSVKMGRMRDGL